MTDPKDDISGEDSAGGEDTIQFMSGNFSEEEHNRAVDTEAEGGEEDEIAMISENFSESDASDDTVDDYEDDDFYDAGESYDDDYSSGGDSGF